ncbi:1762_t:CDS:2 [Acaulospora colombiana]|uniref:1762_t:CDS:1 n=1 Tax=Acaulospora colombiana TaxID=27376 RepID=A0ACA9MU36_9GLOM|nr:1762_t:CDS:2 [Acaulospora colombiana]
MESDLLAATKFTFARAYKPIGGSVVAAIVERIVNLTEKFNHDEKMMFLLWEISSHKIPFGDIDNPIKVAEKVIEGERPGPFSVDMPSLYNDLVEKAWRKNPRKRLAIGEVRDQIKKMMERGRAISTRSDASSSITSYMSDDIKNAPLNNSPLQKLAERGHQTKLQANSENIIIPRT